LQSKCEQHLRLSVAYAELQQVDYDTRQNNAWKEEVKTFQLQMQNLGRQNEYQKELIANRTEHISNLEHALHESNQNHREQLVKHDQAIEDLNLKLKKSQEMVELLFRERDQEIEKKRLPFTASPKIIVPLRGGHLHPSSAGSPLSRKPPGGFGLQQKPPPGFTLPDVLPDSSEHNNSKSSLTLTETEGKTGNGTVTVANSTQQTDSHVEPKSLIGEQVIKEGEETPPRRASLLQRWLSTPLGLKKFKIGKTVDDRQRS